MGLKSRPVTEQAQSHPNARRDFRLPGERRAFGLAQLPRMFLIDFVEVLQVGVIFRFWPPGK